MRDRIAAVDFYLQLGVNNARATTSFIWEKYPMRERICRVRVTFIIK